jgi:hypothetical protein
VGANPAAIAPAGKQARKAVAAAKAEEAPKLECLIVEAEDFDGQPKETVEQHVLNLKPGVPEALKWLVHRSDHARKVRRSPSSLRCMYATG